MKSGHITPRDEPSASRTPRHAGLEALEHRSDSHENDGFSCSNACPLTLGGTIHRTGVHPSHPVSAWTLSSLAQPSAEIHGCGARRGIASETAAPPKDDPSGRRFSEGGPRQSPSIPATSRKFSLVPRKGRTGDLDTSFTDFDSGTFGLPGTHSWRTRMVRRP